ncbi:hypothetical protein T4E_5050 [Trichinella pseudospiralis]|uniref:Uncharacterized protein n=1 Tax=Trichinella pseudospiralis TaxID=6337 RepID=A0A0V0XDG4_TRIPS|nr:hypothetical protein T4E_5050 [Trichinella pseudospiralis]
MSDLQHYQDLVGLLAMLLLAIPKFFLFYLQVLKFYSEVQLCRLPKGI